MKARCRIAVIGLHAASLYYVEPLLRAGRLPNLARLRNEGAFGRLLQPLPPADGAWITLLTGLDPDQTGLVSLLQVDARKCPPIWTDWLDSRAFRDETVLTLLSHAGLRVAAINVPSTAPPWPVNGVLIPGVPVPDEVHPPTYPPDLRRRLPSLNRGSVLALDPSDIAACTRFLDFNLAATVEISTSLYRSEPFDLFWTVLNTPDYAHHLFHANPALAGSWRPLIEAYYDKTDAALGEILTVLDPGTLVIVVSERGCGAAPDVDFHVNVWLEREGLLTRKASAPGSNTALRALHAVHTFAVRTGIAAQFRRYLPSGLLDAGRRLTDHWAFVDFARTRAYAVDHAYPMLGIEVNLCGRQPWGTVDPDDFEAVRDEIISRLGRLRLPGSDRPACHWVARREEVFTGARAEVIADIVGEMDPSVEATTLLGGAVFAPNSGHPAIPFRGYHAREGIFLAQGPGVPANRDLGIAHARDLVPTLLAALGVPLPDGRRGTNRLSAVG